MKKHFQHIADAVTTGKDRFKLLILFSLLMLADSAGSAELVTNGGFEQGAGNVPANWLIRGSTLGVSGNADSTSSVSGAVSLRISGRGDTLDGPQQSIRLALDAGGSGARYAFRFHIKTDDIASVRALLKYSDDDGTRIDQLLAERIITTQDRWTLVEGSFPISWQGTLQSAYIVFEVFQLSRQSGVLPNRLVPSYYLDDVSMDLDSDGDYIMDRDEASLGFNPDKADTDGDGLPDNWEHEHGFSATSNEAADDTDGDGFSNLQEFYAATNPRAIDQYPGKPANQNANAATRAVLQWLALLPSQTQSGHLAVGQMVSDLLSTTEYLDLVDGLNASTGKYPAILQMAIEPPYDKPGDPLQIDEAETRALAHAQAGGLVMLKWAMYNPWVTLGPGTQTSTDLQGLIDPAASTVNTQAINQAAHDTMLSWMTQVADAMERLQQQGVVVMFRPLSEMNGNWFWWGMREQADYVALWHYIYDYFTNTRGLNNIIWVYESDSGTHAPMVVGGPSFASDYYYPGDDYVDVMSHNLYSGSWDLPFDSNEVYSRYPKVYGIPQAGPDHASRDGAFDNLVYLRQSEARLPRSSFFVVWNSFTGSNGDRQNVAIIDNVNATSLMKDQAIITRDELSGLITAAHWPDSSTGSNSAPDVNTNGSNPTAGDISVLPKLAGFSTSHGLETTTDFVIGMQKIGSSQFVTGASTTEMVSVTGFVYPQDNDLDGSADIFVVVVSPTGWLMRNLAGKFVPWDHRISSLVPAYEDQQLTGSLEIELFQGLAKVPGLYRFYVGYMRTDQDELIYTSRAGSFDIN